MSLGVYAPQVVNINLHSLGEVQVSLDRTFVVLLMGRVHSVLLPTWYMGWRGYSGKYLNGTQRGI